MSEKQAPGPAPHSLRRRLLSHLRGLGGLGLCLGRLGLGRLALCGRWCGCKQRDQERRPSSHGTTYDALIAIDYAAAAIVRPAAGSRAAFSTWSTVPTMWNCI